MTLCELSFHFQLLARHSFFSHQQKSRLIKVIADVSSGHLFLSRILFKTCKNLHIQIAPFRKHCLKFKFLQRIFFFGSIKVSLQIPNSANGTWKTICGTCIKRNVKKLGYECDNWINNRQMSLNAGSAFSDTQHNQYHITHELLDDSRICLCSRRTIRRSRDELLVTVMCTWQRAVWSVDFSRRRLCSQLECPNCALNRKS